MKNKKFFQIAAYAVTFGLVGGLSFSGVNYVSNHLAPKAAVEESEKADGDDASSSESKNGNIDKTKVLTTNDGQSNTANTDGVSTVAENVLPSIVAIDITATQKIQDYFGRTYEQEASGSGSGIIVAQDDKNLYVATNNHVVSGADSVSVKFNDDSVVSATVKGVDSDTDLAVVEIKLSSIEADTLKKIKVAALGNSDDVKVGANAIAVGNALGYGTSVTVGYISAKDREVSIEDVTMKLLQTDAAINPGNSGGALVDSKGAVIGINSSKYADTSVEGMGFAIPINTAVPIINDIIKAQKVSEDEAAYLGIKGVDVEEEYAKYYNMPNGIFVSKVTGGSPAEKAGIQSGDIIVKFNGKDVSTMDGMSEKMSMCRAGDKVEIVVKRANNGSYDEKTLTVTLGKKSDAADSQSDDSKSNSDKSQDSGSGSKGYGYNPFGFGN